MASNMVRCGAIVPLALPYARATGEGFKVGSIFAVALLAGTQTDVVNAARVGEWTIKAKTTDQAAVGAKLYWDDTAKELTVAVGTNILAGHATVAKTNGDTTAQVVLTPAGA